MHDLPLDHTRDDTLRTFFYNMPTGPAAQHQSDESHAKRQVLALMKDLGMTEREAAAQSHVDSDSLTEWLYSDSGSSPEVWKLLSAWLAHTQSEREFHPEMEAKFRAFVNDSLCNHNYFQCHHAETVTRNLRSLLERAWHPLVGPCPRG